ncbi:MAG: helix-turn-helix domain-containing protein [Gaiellaceae bacterium]
MDLLDVLGDGALRATLLFARAHMRPVTAAEVAAGLGIPRSVARWRLERLARAGLLVPAFERRSGRTGPGGGRPAKTYAVAVETTQVEFPPRRYDELLRLLIDALPHRHRQERLEQAGAAFGRRLAQAGQIRPAATTRGALEHVCAALGRLGFQASIESASEQEAVLVTPTCPLRPLVVEADDARAIDQGMWRGLLAEALTSTARIACQTHDCDRADSACRIVIALQPQRGR